MSEFTPITTQEQLDTLIGDRIRRARETAEKSFAGYFSPEDHQRALTDLQTSLDSANQTITDQKGTISELTGKIKHYEADAVKIRVATQYGIPLDMRDRLRGETEEEITKDAESFSAYFKQPAPPLAQESNHPAKDDEEAAMRKLANDLATGQI